MCLCLDDYVEEAKTLTCVPKPSAVKVTQELAKDTTTTSLATSVVAGSVSNNMMLALNQLEVFQHVSYMQYVNVKYPNNIQSTMQFMYKANVNTLIPGSQSSSGSTNTSSS